MNAARIRRAVAPALIALAALACFAPRAGAFNIIGNPPSPTSGYLVPPTAIPSAAAPPPGTRFIHWDLREFPNCKIPYNLNLSGTNDIPGLGMLTAMNNGFNTWEAVDPAIIGFDRQFNVNDNTVGQDGKNLLTFDQGVAANLALFPLNTFPNPNTGAFRMSGLLALTALFVNLPTHVIQESDVVFNDRDWQWNLTGDEFFQDLSPYAVNYPGLNGKKLSVKVDGGAAQTVTFGVGATANSVCQQIEAGVAGVLTNVYSSGGQTAIQLVSANRNGTGTIEIVPQGVPANDANGILGFGLGPFTTRGADVETVALHEEGHFCGLHHSSNDGAEPNPVYTAAVMYFAAPATGTKRALTADDTDALNFMYTPDLGDAPDPTPTFNKYQTLVHSTTPSRMLSGVQLYQPGLGPEHLFGYFGSDTLKLEWLGDIENGHKDECEAFVTNLDASDDGVALPFPMYRGQPNVVQVTISYKNAARYNSAQVARRLMFNGYFDWNNDQLFDNSDLDIWWTGDPTNGTFSSSPNWTAATYTPGKINLVFNVTPPVNAPSTYARFRLDLGEDEGRQQNWMGDLGPAIGAAQFGEVEDYYVATTSPVTAVQVGRFEGLVAGNAIDVSWSTPEGGVSQKVNLYRTIEGVDVEELLGGISPGPDGGSYHDAAVVPGKAYHYRLGLFDTSGEVVGPSIRVVMPEAELSLAGMAPNPANRLGTATFTLPRAGRAHLAMYGVDGRRVRLLADGEFGAGTQHVQWDGNDDGGNAMAPGIYFLKLTYGNLSRVSRTVVLR
jgi:hypothetical protein